MVPREKFRGGGEQKLERLVDVDDRGALMLQNKPDVASRDVDARRAYYRALARAAADGNEVLGLEDPERLPQRWSRHAKRLAQFALDREVVALLQFTSNDAAPDF